LHSDREEINVKTKEFLYIRFYVTLNHGLNYCMHWLLYALMLNSFGQHDFMAKFNGFVLDLVVFRLVLVKLFSFSCIFVSWPRHYKRY